jgi:hypothetical protein
MVRRWDFYVDYDHIAGREFVEQITSEDGEWVSYDDYATLTAERDMLAKEYERLRGALYQVVMAVTKAYGR